jgi:hypothetical protein
VVAGQSEAVPRKADEVVVDVHREDVVVPERSASSAALYPEPVPISRTRWPSRTSRFSSILTIRSGFVLDETGCWLPLTVCSFVTSVSGE